MAVEDYDTGVTRKTHDEVTEADRAQSRANIDPSGTRWNANTGWWDETFSPHFVDRDYSQQGGGYYAPGSEGGGLSGSDWWTDSTTESGFSDPWGTPIVDPVTGRRNPPAPEPGEGGESDEYKKYLEWMKAQGIAGAKSVMKGFLNQFGLGKLSDWAMAQAEKGLTGDAIVIEMRYGTDPNVRSVYDAKFPAMGERRKRGFMEITEQEYLQLGRGYSQIAGAAGISADFLSGDGITVAEDGVTSLIAGDVSLAEWRGRVQTAEEAVFKASDQVKALLETRYGFSSGDLVSAFLDPSKTKNIVDARRQLGAATLAGAAQNVIGSPISEAGSEWMFNQDIQAREVVQALSPLRGLTEGTLTSDAMSADELAGGKFGGGYARKKFQRNLQGRVSDFDTSSGIALGQQGVYGLGAAK